MSTIKKIGILCEDQSDFESLKVIIRRTIDVANMPVEGAYFQGCGRLKRKAKDYSDYFKEKKGCDMLVLVHDLDDNDLLLLEKELDAATSGHTFGHHLICIPVQELEGWLLSDAAALRVSLKLKKEPKVPNSPENIDSPKEYLEDLICKTSEKEKYYMPTRDNIKVAAIVSLDILVKKCPSFKKLSDFLTSRTYKLI